MSGIISLTFDDGYAHIHDDVLPVLNTRKMPGVFAVPIDDSAVSTSEHMDTTPHDQWLQAKLDGHEIAAHGVTHTDLTTLSRTNLSTELEQPVLEMSATTIVYPGGAYNKAVVEGARNHYSAGRTTNRGFETLPPANIMQLATFNYTRRNWSLLKANARVIWALLTGKWLIETFHIVSDAADSPYCVPLSDFKKHVAFIDLINIPVKTISQVID